MKIEDLERYIPETHGEQGVDAVLHSVTVSGEKLNEVACEPPGGSWNSFDIVHPETSEIYKWDNAPRHPPKSVKKPDLVIQMNEADEIHILMIESKIHQNDLISNIGKKMEDFFIGNDDFTGIRQRPTWHRNQGAGWNTIGSEAFEDKRFWLRDYESLSVWTGFAFAQSGSSKSQVNLGDFGVGETGSDSQIERRLRTILNDSDINVAATVGWSGKYDYPTLYLKSDREFNNSPIWTAFEQISPDHNLDIELL